MPRPLALIAAARPAYTRLAPATVSLLALRRHISTTAAVAAPRSSATTGTVPSASSPSSDSSAASPEPIPPTTVALGTAFEHHALSLLNTRLHMLLRRVGGRGDGGIDLRGEWWLPKPKPTSSPFFDHESEPVAFGAISIPASDDDRVHPPGLNTRGKPSKQIRSVGVWAQCKAEAKALGPRVVRELDGVLASRPASGASGASAASPPSSPSKSKRKAKDEGSERGETLGVLVSRSGFSRQALLAALRARGPVLLVHLPFDYHGEADDVVLGATYNPPFAQFLETHRIELRREICNVTSTPTLAPWYAGSRMGRYGPEVPPIPEVAPIPDLPKRPRGRPRKVEVQPKRRGRPRKTPEAVGNVKTVKKVRSKKKGAEGAATPAEAPTVAEAASSAEASGEAQEKPKRGRGRPRKVPESNAEVMAEETVQAEQKEPVAAPEAGTEAAEKPKRGKGKPRTATEPTAEIKAEKKKRTVKKEESEGTKDTTGATEAEVAEKPKRGRGRPRKVQADAM